MGKYLLNIIGLRIRLIYRNKATLALTLLTMTAFIMLVGSLYENEDNSNKVPIAYVDMDNSEFSNEVIRNIQGNELLKATNTNLKEGIRKVKEGEIQVLFVIHDGAGKKVEKSDYNELIDLYYISDNYLPPMIGDVVVGEFLEEVCILSSLNYLELAMEGRAAEADLQGAYEYAKSISQDKKSDYYVTIEYIDLSRDVTVQKDEMGNILFKQMILGIMLTFIAFYILFASIYVVKDRENGLYSKIQISKTSVIPLVFADYFSICIVSFVMGLVCSGLNAYYSKSPLRTGGYDAVLLILYIMALSGLFFLLAHIVKGVSSFIVVGSSIILIFGIIGGCFFNIDISVPAIKQLANVSPAYHALRQLIRVIVYNELVDFKFYLAYMGGIVIVCLGLLCFLRRTRWV